MAPSKKAPAKPAKSASRKAAAPRSAKPAKAPARKAAAARQPGAQSLLNAWGCAVMPAKKPIIAKGIAKMV